MRRLPMLALAVLAVAILLGGSATPALAHERRTVANKYDFVVGFIEEPAIQGFKNGASLRVTNRELNQPVEGLEQTLKVTVTQGSASQEFSLSPVFGQPGLYSAHFIPTRAGSYTFRFTGTIEGTSIDETFESGPGRFNDVEPSADLQFPDKVGEAGDSAELQRSVDNAATAARTAVDVANDAQAAASSAQTFGIAGVVVGLVGIVLAGVALSTRRRA